MQNLADESFLEVCVTFVYGKSWSSSIGKIKAVVLNEDYADWRAGLYFDCGCGGSILYSNFQISR